MNYREEMQKTALSDEQKEKIASAVEERRRARRAERERVRRSAFAGISLSLALALIVAAPVGIYFGLRNAEGPSANWPQFPSGGDNAGGENSSNDPSGPEGPGDDGPGGDVGAPELADGINGKIVDYKSSYNAGEAIVLTCRIVAGDSFTLTETENGFSVVSCELLSSGPYAQLASMTEYTYRIELEAAGEGEHLAGGMIFHTTKGYTQQCILYGYRPKEGAYSGGAIYTSTVSKDGAFSAYLYFLVGLGEITMDEYHERLSEYWRESGGVHEDETVS